MSDCYAHTVAAGICFKQLCRFAWIAIATAALLVLILPAAGRADETLFAAKFPSIQAKQPPTHNQTVGTATWWGPPRDRINGVFAGYRALWFQRLPGVLDEVGFRGRFSHTRGYGNYTVSIKLTFWPYDPAFVDFKTTLDFEPRDQQTHPPARFLRLEFLPNRQLRFDDNNATIFGHYKPDVSMLLTITLNENQVMPNVHVDLHPLDGSPDFTADYMIQRPLRELAREFGAITISLASRPNGQVEIDSMSVNYCAC